MLKLQRGSLLLLVFLLLLLTVGAVGCSSEEEQQYPITEVSTVEAERRVVTYFDQYPGRVEASQLAELRSRINGFVSEIHFREGAFIQKDDLLYTIDPRGAETNQEVRRAEVRAAEGELEFAQSNFKRAEKLLKTNAISREEYQSRRRQLAVAEAALEAAKERLRSSTSDLDYAYVRAPFAGRVSETLVDVGNLTRLDTLLTTVAALDPIYVEFDIDEQSAIQYRKSLPGFDRLLRGEEPNSPIQIEIEAGIDGSSKHTGTLTFVDNALDRETGTLLARAIIENNDFLLQPNFFVRVQIPRNSLEPRVVIPYKAVLSQQTNRSVYTLSEESTVSVQRVRLGARLGDSVEVLEGLEGGEEIIIDNLVMLGPGQPVKKAGSSDQQPQSASLPKSRG